MSHTGDLWVLGSAASQLGLPPAAGRGPTSRQPLRGCDKKTHASGCLPTPTVDGGTSGSGVYHANDSTATRLCTVGRDTYRFNLRRPGMSTYMTRCPVAYEPNAGHHKPALQHLRLDHGRH